MRKINGSGIAKINKSSIWYQINKFKQTNSILARKACDKPHKNLDSLKHSLITAWNDIDADMIRVCSLNAHKRLKAVVKAEGGYIKEK